MRTDLFHVISQTSEDRFGETQSLDDAVRLARSLAHEILANERVAIEHRGIVIRQLVLMPDGKLKEEKIS